MRIYSSAITRISSVLSLKRRMRRVRTSEESLSARLMFITVRNLPEEV